MITANEAEAYKLVCHLHSRGGVEVTELITPEQKTEYDDFLHQLNRGEPFSSFAHIHIEWMRRRMGEQQI